MAVAKRQGRPETESGKSKRKPACGREVSFASLLSLTLGPRFLSPRLCSRLWGGTGAANAQIVSAHSVERGNYGYVPADVEIQKRKLLT